MKKCSNCGRECEDKDRFCLICGTEFTNEPNAMPKENPGVEKLQERKTQRAVENAADEGRAEETAPNNEPAKHKKKAKNILILAGGIAVILLVLVIAVLILKGDGYLKISPDATMLVYSDDKEGYVYVTAQGSTVLLEAESVYQTEQSLDESQSAVLADYDYLTGSGDLYYMNGTTAVLVSENTSSFKLSDNGKGIAYIKGSSEYVTGDLYLYNTEDESSTKIDSGVKIDSVCISQDGKSVAYVGSYSSDYSFKGYKSINGDKPEEMGENIIPIAVSDGGKYLYYYEYDGYTFDLYVKHKKSEVKLATNMNYGSTIFLNEEYTQLLYTDDGKTYLSNKGDVKEKLSSSEMQYCLLPENGAYRENYTTESTIYVYGISDFEELVVVMNGSLYYLGKNFEAEMITDYVYQYQLSEDNKSLLYTYGGSLFYIKNIKKDRTAEEIGSDLDIYTFAASDDLSQVYYTDSDDTLYYKKGSKDSRKVADGVYYTYALRGSDNRFFYLMEYDEYEGAGILYTAKWGRFRKEIDMGEDVYSAFTFNGSAFYYKMSDDGYSYDLYCSEKGKDFELIVKNVMTY